jgi:hypothetical protein
VKWYADKSGKKIPRVPGTTTHGPTHPSSFSFNSSIQIGILEGKERDLLGAEDHTNSMSEKYKE